MRSAVIFLCILITIFLTERLEKVFYIGIFDLYPSRILYIYLLLTADFAIFRKMSPEVKRVFYIYFGFLGVSLLSALTSGTIVYSMKKWLDLFTIGTFPVLIYSFLYRNTKSLDSNQLYKIFVKNFKLIVLFICVGGLFLYRHINGGMLEPRSFLGIDFYRRISFFHDPNFYSTCLVVSFFIILFSEIKYRNAVLFFILFSILLTGSKGGFGALIGTLVIHYRQNIPILRSNIFLGVAAFVVFIGLGIVLVYPLDVLALLFESDLYRSQFNLSAGITSAIPRLLAWYGGFRAFLNEPLLGVGPGNIVNVNKGEYADLLIQFSKDNGSYGLAEDKISELATHSTYLELLFETGIIAFIFYILYLITFITLLLKYGKMREYNVMGYALGFISFCINILFLSYNPFFIAGLNGITLFLIDKKNYFDGRHQVNSQ